MVIDAELFYTHNPPHVLCMCVCVRRGTGNEHEKKRKTKKMKKKMVGRRPCGHPSATHCLAVSGRKRPCAWGRRVRENPNKKDGDEHDDAENVVHMKDSKRQGFRRRQEDAGVSH